MIFDRLPKPRRFIILFHPRSGSSWLRSVLAANKNFRMDYEPFANRMTAAEQTDYMRSTLTKTYDPMVEAVGFKAAPYQIIDKPGFAALMKELRARAIVLHRRDLVRTTISQLRADALAAATRDGLTNLHREEDRLPPITVDLETLLPRMREIEREQGDVKLLASALSVPTCKLTYEELAADMLEALKRLAQFLRVPIVPLPGNLHKNTPDDLTQAVANHAEMMAFLEAHGRGLAGSAK